MSAYFRAYFYEEGMLNGIYAYTLAPKQNIVFYKAAACRELYDYRKAEDVERWKGIGLTMYRLFAEYPAFAGAKDMAARCEATEKETHYIYYGIEELTKEEYMNTPRIEYLGNLSPEFMAAHHDCCFLSKRPAPPSQEGGEHD